MITLVAFSFGCRKSNINNKDLQDFEQINLVANNAGYGATHVDPTLSDAWGLAFTGTGIPWVNSLGGHVSEIYSSEGVILRPPVKIPSPGDTVGGLPTGIVFSAGKGFKLANGAAASFLFVGIDGVLSGWNGGNNAQRIGTDPAGSYTGLALAASGGKNYIYAANFKTGKINVWDTTFAPVWWMPFKDPGIPPGYAPFNIQSVGSWLFVTYAKVAANGKDQAGAGNGFVDAFNTDGSFVQRFASRGTLNAPWGVTMAASGFLVDADMDSVEEHGSTGSNNSGKLGSDELNQPVILVGNFGDGRINVFGEDGRFLGQLQSHNRAIVIDGLWALSFPPSTATSIDPKRLYFTAGPKKETDGIFGYLVKQ